MIGGTLPWTPPVRCGATEVRRSPEAPSDVGQTDDGCSVTGQPGWVQHVATDGLLQCKISGELVAYHRSTDRTVNEERTTGSYNCPGSS